MWKTGVGFTSQCNMHCDHCYSKSIRRKERNPSQDVLPKYQVFVQKNQNNIEDINYGTGENTIIPQWYTLVEIIHSINPSIKQGLTTNGSFVQYNGSAKLTTIAERMSDIDVSIDFYLPELHNAMRQHKYAFKWALEALQFCCEHSIERTIAMVATPQSFTQDNISGIFRLAHQYESNVRINIYRPVQGITPDKYVIVYDQLMRSLSYILENYTVVRMSDPLFSALLDLDHCVGDCSGRRSFRILPTGDVTPSTYLITEEWVSVNILEYPTFDLNRLHATPPFQRLISSPIPPRCERCEKVDTCQGGAYDRRWLWYSSLTEPDPYCPYVKEATNPLERVNISFQLRMH